MLRAMVRWNLWCKIGEIFGFEPRYSTIANKRYFDWTCCPPEFWAVFQPSKFARGNVAILANNYRRSQFKTKRPATKLHPTVQMITFEAQQGVCFYCEKTIEWINWSIDHKTPMSRGGSNHRSNKVGACKTCNREKANLTEEEFRTTPVGERKALIKKVFEGYRRDGIWKRTLLNVAETSASSPPPASQSETRQPAQP